MVTLVSNYNRLNFVTFLVYLPAKELHFLRSSCIICLIDTYVRELFVLFYY